MIRTQIRLDATEYKLLKEQSRALGVSLEEIIRRAIRDVLPHDNRGAWMRFAGLVESGDSRLSQSVDEVAYGVEP